MFYVTEPAALAAVPQLLLRLKAAGALPVVLAKVLHDAEQLQLAVQLDAHHLTRNIKAQQCVHMFNVYAEQAAGSLTYLHQVNTNHQLADIAAPVKVLTACGIPRYIQHGFWAAHAHIVTQASPLLFSAEGHLSASTLSSGVTAGMAWLAA